MSSRDPFLCGEDFRFRTCFIPTLTLDVHRTPSFQQSVYMLAKYHQIDYACCSRSPSNSTYVYSLYSSPGLHTIGTGMVLPG